MSRTWSYPENIRRAVWQGTRHARDFVHGRRAQCHLSFEQAEWLLAAPDRGGHDECIACYLDGLIKLRDPKVAAGLATADHPERYVSRVIANLWRDEVRRDIARRGGNTKPRQLRGVRLKISEALADPWLDELASLLLEWAASSRNPAAGWPIAEFVARKAAFLHRPPLEGDADEVRTELALVQAVMRRVDEKWYRKYVLRPQQTWSAHYPESLDATSAAEHAAEWPGRDQHREALLREFRAQLQDPEVPSFTEAVGRAARALGGEVSNPRLLCRAGGALLVELLGGDIGVTDAGLILAVEQSLGATAAAKIDRHACAAVRAAIRD